LIGGLIDGELSTSTRPPGTRTVHVSFGELIGLRYGLGIVGLGHRWILHLPDLHLGGDVLASDLAGSRRAF